MFTSLLYTLCFFLSVFMRASVLAFICASSIVRALDKHHQSCSFLYIFYFKESIQWNETNRTESSISFLRVENRLSIYFIKVRNDDK